METCLLATHTDLQPFGKDCRQERSLSAVHSYPGGAGRGVLGRRDNPAAAHFSSFTHHTHLARSSFITCLCHGMLTVFCS